MNELSKKHNIAPWQVSQAKKAISLFLEYQTSDKNHKRISGEHNWQNIFEQVKQEIRYLHYSFRTEKTYLYWIKQLMFFVKNISPEKVSSKDVKEFLSLTIRKRIEDY